MYDDDDIATRKRNFLLFVYLRALIRRIHFYYSSFFFPSPTNCPGPRPRLRHPRQPTSSIGFVTRQFPTSMKAIREPRRQRKITQTITIREQKGKTKKNTSYIRLVDARYFFANYFLKNPMNCEKRRDHRINRRNNTDQARYRERGESKTENK